MSLDLVHVTISCSQCKYTKIYIRYNDGLVSKDMFKFVRKRCNISVNTGSGKSEQIQ